jgi:hypothetical protein
MELHGTISDNLKMAVESSRRLKGHPVYRDTLQFWSDLIKEARAKRGTKQIGDSGRVDELIAELESALSENAR